MSDPAKPNFVIIPQMGRDGFIARLRERFPAIEASIDKGSRGLLHCEMGCFARATQTAINAGNANEVRKHFEFADELFRDGGPDVENAIIVSYLESIHFDGEKAKAIMARGMLSARLQLQLRELEAHLFRVDIWNATRS